MITNSAMNGRECALGFVAGLAGGALGTLGMNAAQTLMRRGAEALGVAQNAGERSEENEPKQRGGDNPTEKFYARIANPESEREKRIGGSLVHIGFGAAAGALYGVIASVDRRVTTGRGIPFGAAVWLVANEIGLAAAGLTKSPAKYEPATHAFALISHLVYGGVTDAGVRLGLGSRRTYP